MKNVFLALSNPTSEEAAACDTVTCGRSEVLQLSCQSNAAG